MGKLFGTDGIRGEANRHPMDAAMAFSVGQAVTHLLKKKNHRPRVIIGKDTRISGDMLESSLTAGITSMGGDPYLVGILPTPGIAFITQSMRANAGIMISASHNPYQDNGIKIFAGNGFKLSNEQEEVIEKFIQNGKLPEMVSQVSDMGRTHRIEDSLSRYVSFLKNTFPAGLSMEGIKIVIDAANGATFKVAPHVFTELGGSVEVIHNNPNGININDNCGSQYTQDLEKRVVDTGADIGLAFDGDGDRLIVVDEKGHTITGDQILIICAKSLKDQGKLKNDLLVGTVMSNFGLTIACKKYGLKYYASKVGDRSVLEDMQRLDAIIGGEQSGHIIFRGHHTTGDGILAGIQLIAAMIEAKKPLSELTTMMEIFPQKLISVEVRSKPEISTVPKVVDAMKKVESELGDQGRVLVRYSGTQNLCRVMVEGPTDDLTEKYCKHIADEVKRALG
jgi:phosphoglucosamine mutase